MEVTFPKEYAVWQPPPDNFQRIGNEWVEISQELHTKKQVCHGPCVVKKQREHFYANESPLHRLNGPAVIGVFGQEKKWFLMGVRLTRSEFMINRFDELLERALIFYSIRDYVPYNCLAIILNETNEYPFTLKEIDYLTFNIYKSVGQL